jgi:orotidine-5'-phosphate decarboxylase
VRDLVGAGRRVFLDLKYHDIPNTVGAAVREAGRLGVSLLTVHGAGGSKMLRAAAKAARESNPAMKVVAVTVLTSMDEEDLHEIGVPGNLEKQVVHVAKLAVKAGCHGVVSSAREAKALRSHLGNDFLVITPGVRPAGSALGDQARAVTPAEAIAAGSTHLVVGRPITGAANPSEVAEKIIREIEHASQLVTR